MVEIHTYIDHPQKLHPHKLNPHIADIILNIHYDCFQGMNSQG